MPLFSISTAHLSRKDFFNVYEPSEDSFLMMDTIEEQLQWLKGSVNPTVVCEIGSGSGIVSSLLSMAFPHSLLISTDINEFACRATQRTITANETSTDINTSANSMRSTILRDKRQSVHEIVQTLFMDGLRATADLIVFNPPYVPTCDIEHRTPLDFAWDGGDERGRKVIDAFIGRLPVS